MSERSLARAKAMEAGVLPTWQKENAKRQKHTTGGIPRWSPTLVLIARFSAYVWQSGRDAQFSLTYGRMCLSLTYIAHVHKPGDRPGKLLIQVVTRQ